MKVIKWPSAKNSSCPDKSERRKIVLEKCPRSCVKCKSVLAEINRCFYESDNHQQNKEYQLSILSLKKAYQKTFELREPADKNCGKVFRMVIIDSLKTINNELIRMSAGSYRKNHYKFSRLMAEKTLKELTASSAGEFKEINLNFKDMSSGVSFG